MNKKAQTTALGALFGLIVFGIIFFGGMTGYVSDYGQGIINNGDLTGLQALFFANLNLVIALAWLITLLAIGRYGFG